MRFNYPEDVIALTPEWKGERFEDGRPKVPDRYLDEIRKMTLEELWKPIFLKGYVNQFLAMDCLHPEFKENGDLNCKLIGRAVTAAYGPARPDYFEASNKQAASEGRSGLANQWVIDSLTDRDVAIIDMFDKVYKGTFVGGNLTTAIKAKTHTGGAVIWGGIRDIEQMKKIDGINVYYRGIDPALCLPGDIVYGCSGGVLFIPPQMVVEVVENGAKTQIKDIFGFEMITQNKFTTAQIDLAVWTEEMLDHLIKFIKTDERGKEYRQLDWSEEYRLAKEGDFSQSAL